MAYELGVEGERRLERYFDGIGEVLGNGGLGALRSRRTRWGC